MRTSTKAKVVAGRSSTEELFSIALQRIRSKESLIAIMGLGYVGLPLARLFVQKGYPVLGVDTDAKKVKALSDGKSYIKLIESASVREMNDTKRFRATADRQELSQAHAIIICVPTPLTQNREPDMSFVERTSEAIRDALVPGQLIVLESTTYPGTLREVVKTILEQTGMVAGKDFFMAYSPEREDPGNQTHSAAHLPKVVGGLDKKSHELAETMYAAVVPQVVNVSSPEIAEACKILENTYRAVNIAMVNELKILFQEMDLDIWEVIEAAKTKPFGFQAFYPGPGLGGHCIPIDPFYLTWLARRFHCNTKFIELAGEINTSMPEYVVHRVSVALNAKKKPIAGSKIGILGIAYKKNVDDPRESPSFELIEKLSKLGAQISYNDPFIPELPSMRKYDISQKSEPLTPEYLRSLDCTLIATDHSAYDPELIVKHSNLIVDTRNLTGKVVFGRDKIWKA